MQSEDIIRVRHIIEEAGVAFTYTEGLSFDEFVKDGKTVRAVIRVVSPKILPLFGGKKAQKEAL